MKLDKTFSREISRISNGDGSREAKFAFLKMVREANKALSTPEVMRTYGDCLKQFGRVPVAICTAATIISRCDRLNDGPVNWAREVLKLWTNRPADLNCAHIDDGLHPTKIEDTARNRGRASPPASTSNGLTPMTTTPPSSRTRHPPRPFQTSQNHRSRMLIIRSQKR